LRRDLEIAFNADKMSLRVRWFLLPLWAILGFDSSGLVTVAIGLALNALVGFIVQKKNSTIENYQKGASSLVAHLRMIDVFGSCALSVLSPSAFGNAWLIAIPVIIFDGISTRNSKRVLMLITGSLGLLVYGALMSEKLYDVLIPSVIVTAAGFLGIALARFQSKERFLEERDRRLTTLMNTASSLASSGDLRNLILTTLKSAVHDLGATAGMVCLTSEEDPGLLITEAAYSRDGEFLFPVVIGIGEGVSGYVAKEGQPITLTSNGTGFIDIDGIGIPVKSAVSVPLVNRNFSGVGMAQADSIMGSFTIVNSEMTNALEAEELDVLQSLAGLMANAIHNARMEEKQRATFIRTMESLATALEARDEYTRGHSQRVCDLSVMLGSKLGLMPDALEELRIGTILHDIGKIGVPDAILNKPGRLTDEEFQFMRTHPVIGYEICVPLMLSEGVLMIIRNHHEKLDGSGYPDGLKGGELPLSLRIVCVADAFDAMSSRRPYRGVMDMSHVIGELSKGAGSQFDSVVVEALKSLLAAGSLDELYAAYWTKPSASAPTQPSSTIELPIVSKPNEKTAKENDGALDEAA
jgi:GAF domain-containing protein